MKSDPDDAKSTAVDMPSSPISQHVPFPVNPASSQTNNGFATASFGLGVASLFLYQIGIIPLLGIIFGVRGLSTFKETVQKNKWMAITGLSLSLIYMILSATFWAQLGKSPSEVMAGKSAPIARGPQSARKKGDFRLNHRRAGQ
jgi:hypothetical protein